jgi:DNA-binding NarL/FixJ family response regulator
LARLSPLKYSGYQTNVSETYRLPALAAPLVLRNSNVCSQGLAIQGRRQAARVHAGPVLRNFEPPKAQVYVVDAHAARQATGALLTNLLERVTDARLIVVGDGINDTNAYSLLRLGVKGILSYAEARDQLARALPLVSQGGFWVPRSVLSGFVDSILTSQGRRMKTESITNQLPRTGSGLLLENLSNKEIASKLNIAERTVNFTSRTCSTNSAFVAAPI